MSYDAINSTEIDTGKMAGKTLWTKVKDCLDWLYGQVGSLSGGATGISNGSFEIDSDVNGVPDGWTRSLYPGGAGVFDTTTPYHGAQAVKLTHPGGAGNGGGYYESDYVAIMPNSTNPQKIGFVTKASAAGMKNIVEIRYYTAAKSYISSENVYNSTANPSAWTYYQYGLTVPSTARYLKARMIGGYTDTNVAGDCYYDNVYLDLTSIIINGTINTEKLKTAQGSVSSSTAQNLTLPGGEYGFYPQIRNASGGSTNEILIGKALTSGSFATNIYIDGGGATIYAQQRYVTSSGTQFWLFLLYDTTNKKIIACYAAPEHPAANNGGKEANVPHPFAEYHGGKVLPGGCEIILLDMDSIQVLQGIADVKKIDVLEALHETIGTTHDIDVEKEVPWVARDMDGHKKLTEKSVTWVQRRLVEKKKM